MSSSYTDTGSNTYSEADVKKVLGKIFDDFHAIDARGFEFIEKRPKYLQDLRDDLFYIMVNKDLDFFQFQFKFDGKEKAVEYKVSSDGSVQQDSDSGGIDYFDFPSNSKIGMVVRRKGCPKVWDYLAKRGWTRNGKFVEGQKESFGGYSSGNLGITKNIIG